jgi:LacI family transcriptional regulator
MAKVTIYDIAKKLNVSTASVTRALNGLPKVGDEKRKLIIKTAEEMGYKTNQLAASLSRNPIKIAVVLYASIQEFYEKIESGIEDAFISLKDFNIDRDMYVLNSSDTSDEDFVRTISDITRKDYAGVLIHSIHDNPAIIEAVENLLKSGKIVYTINSDISIHKLHYSIMSNAGVAGRMAAELLDWSVSNRKICHFLGGREAQMLNTLNNAFVEEAEKRGLSIIARYYDDDSVNAVCRNVETMLKDHPDVGGIYVSSAISYAVCNCLVKMNYDRKIRLITSDLLQDIRTHIRNNVVQATIFQDPYKQGRDGFSNLYRMIAEGLKLDNQILVTPLILTKSNIDLY